MLATTLIVLRGSARRLILGHRWAAPILLNNHCHGTSPAAPLPESLCQVSPPRPQQPPQSLTRANATVRRPRSISFRLRLLIPPVCSTKFRPLWTGLLICSSLLRLQLWRLHNTGCRSSFAAGNIRRSGAHRLQRTVMVIKRAHQCVAVPSGVQFGPGFLCGPPFKAWPLQSRRRKESVWRIPA